MTDPDNTAPPPARQCRARHRVASLAAAIGLAVLTPAAGASMRCGSELVTHGDHKLEVLRNCGEPELRESRTVYRHFGVNGDVHAGVLISVDIDEWTYNFGPRRFMRMVRFANSRVERVIRLDYGY